MLTGRVRRTINHYKMLQRNDRVAVAVSGGPDSVALLRVLDSLKEVYGISLFVAHLNHGLRAEEAAADEAFVKSLAQELGLEHISRFVKVQAYADQEGLNLEEAGRIVRYEFLQNAARIKSATKIALGHTLNDQAETVIMRFIRGSGLDGLSSIRPIVTVSDHLQVIRPLIECSRDDVLEFLREGAFNYRMDRSNQDLRFDRNRVRAELIPYLAKHFNPNIVETLARYATLSGEDSALLNDLAKKAADRLLKTKGTDYHLEIGPLLEHPRAIQRRIIRAALKQIRGDLRRVRFSQVESILRLMRPGMSGKEVGLPTGLKVVREFSELIFVISSRRDSPAFLYKLPIPGSIEIREACCRFEATIVEKPCGSSESEESARCAAFDPGVLANPLIIRNRLPGDRYPINDYESKKIKDIMIEGKIPKSLRQKIPLVVSDSKIIWIPGFPVATIYKPKGDTQRYVVIRMKDLKE